ncbi:MAG: SGNH/GDSL hydrolase family protein [Rhodospirillales bacterium]|nr:SGNH/GDSL hydrolase family protein [Rhodospirillales bacterium]
MKDPQPIAPSRYTTIARGILGAFLFVVAVNVLAWMALEVRDLLKVHGGALVPANPWAIRTQVYPGMTPDDIYQLHMESWELRNYEYQPMSEFREGPFRGRFVNVTDAGYRKGRRDDPWPPSPADFSIFVFGGSTTFGYGLPDDQTVPAALSDAASRVTDASAPVYNFGRAYFFSTHELLEFQRLLMAGYRPSLALFVDGINEFAFDGGGDLLWSQRIRQALGRAYVSPANSLRNLAAALPINELASFVFRYLNIDGTERERDAQANVARILGEANIEKVNAVLDRYLRNKALIETLGRHYDVPVAFVWQPVPTYKYDLNHHLFAYRDMRNHLSSGAGYRRAAERFARGDFGANFAWCADIQEGVAKPLYVDAVHYSAELAAMLADCIVAKTPLKDLAAHRSPKG